MGRKKITAESLAKEVQKIINSYQDIVWDNVDDAAKRVAKKARTAVANGSKQFDTRWGEGVYSKGWRVTEEKGLWWSSYIVYQKNVPTETHLLEYGHALIPGVRMYNRKHELIGINHARRARAYPHIKPVAAKVPDDMQKEAISAIQRSG